MFWLFGGKKKAKDTCITLCPYFKLKEGAKMDDVRAKFMKPCYEKTAEEPGMLFYGFSVTQDGQQVHCREGYKDADDLLFHLDNVGEPLGEGLKLMDLERLECHCTAAQYEVVKEKLTGLGAIFFILDDEGPLRVQ